MLTDNDYIVLLFIEENTNRFSKKDIEDFNKKCTSKDIEVLRTLFYNCSELDYDWDDGMAQIQLSQIVQIIIF